MYDSEGPEEGDTAVPGETAQLTLVRTPPLRLAGVDEDDTWEPHLVRGID